jgi:outer membrane immunogenic protein
VNRSIFVAAAAAGAVLASAAPGFAADWNGAYAGLNLGVAFGDSNVSTQVGSNSYFAASSISSIAATSPALLKPNGVTGGGQIGFNYQMGRWVAGLEGDFDALDLSQSASTGAIPYPCCSSSTYTIVQKVHANWVATVRPRIGWTTNDWMIYATGGAAFTDLKASASFSDTFGPVSEASSRSETKTGWTAGAGLEWAVGPHASLRFEYLHDDFGKVGWTGTVISGTTLVHSADLKADVLRIGTNWRF